MTDPPRRGDTELQPYWDRVSRAYAPDDPLAAVCYPGAPVWLNRFFAGLQWGSVKRALAGAELDGASALKDGYLFLHDRMKDLIISGGENIYPAEVENVLMQHPALADGAVVGVPDEQWGEAVKACVVLKPGMKASGAEIIEFMRGRIAHFKCPKSIDFLEQIPRNPTGKILKRVLREPYWRGRERRIN